MKDILELYDLFEGGINVYNIMLFVIRSTFLKFRHLLRVVVCYQIDFFKFRHLLRVVVCCKIDFFFYLDICYMLLIVIRSTFLFI